MGAEEDLSLKGALQAPGLSGESLEALVWTRAPGPPWLDLLDARAIGSMRGDRAPT
jgi:hypothetical protein